MNFIKSIYRIIALTLAFLMFITSMGFTVDMHFCRGHLQSVSFLGKAKSCDQMLECALMKKCPHYKKMMAQNGKCILNEKDNCENKTLHFQLDQDQGIQQLNLELSTEFKQFIAVYSAAFFLNSSQIQENLPSLIHYKPPLIYRDIPILVQSFLI